MTRAARALAARTSAYVAGSSTEDLAALIQSPLQELRDPQLMRCGLRVLVKRDDLLHPIISGNKWRKLKYNLMVARRQRFDTLLTFGGAYSNHLHAVAAAGKVCGFNTIGVVRGTVSGELNPTLIDARRAGMTLYFVDREAYRDKDSPAMLHFLRQRFGRFFMLPEGGANTLALTGCAELAQEIVDQLGEPPGAVMCACGTGATLAGLVSTLPPQTEALGVSTLNGGGFLYDAVERLLRESAIQARCRWRVLTNFHHGGYAKCSDGLLEFIGRFRAINQIPIEPIYTGKMFFALYEMILSGQFEAGTTIVAVHTGGLQGLRGMADRLAPRHNASWLSDYQPA